MAFARIGELSAVVSFNGVYDKNDQVRKNEIDNTIIQNNEMMTGNSSIISIKNGLWLKNESGITLKSKKMT